MSGLTGNLDCEECLSPTHVSNTTELNLHSAADDDDELLRYIWREYLHPKQYEWVLIVAYIIVFFVSLIGNSLGEFESAKACAYLAMPVEFQQLLPVNVNQRPPYKRKTT